MELRLARPEAAPALAEIYGYYVRRTAISFEIQSPGADDMAARVRAAMPAFPWLVATEEGTVRGFACAGPHRRRAAYRWSVEPSIYLDMNARGQGLGTQLYRSLLDLLTAQGYLRALAGITLPNQASRGLHRTLGFQEVGVYRRVGFKHGRWHDVWWGSLDLVPRSNGRPGALTPIDELKARGELQAILES